MADHSGTLISGDPVVCGGYNGDAYDVKCFHFERSTKKWKRVNLLEIFDNLSKNNSNLKKYS